MNNLKTGAGQVPGVSLEHVTLKHARHGSENHSLIPYALISTLTARDGHEPLARHLQDVQSSIVLD